MPWVSLGTVVVNLETGYERSKVRGQSSARQHTCTSPRNVAKIFTIMKSEATLKKKKSPLYT